MTLTRLILILFLLTNGLAKSAWGEDPTVIIQSTKVGTPLEQLTNAVTIITESDIKASGATAVLDLLRGVEASDIVQAGGPGGQTSLFLRGAESNHVLVVIDGVKVNTPTTGAYDFAHLTVDQIERIEILRGAQSPLYGSDAVGGVISITTKQGHDKPTGAFSVSGGSYNSWRAALDHSARGRLWDHSLTVSRSVTGGFSRADERNGNTERDAYENTTFASRFGRNIGTGGRLDFTARLIDGTSEIDDIDFVTGLPIDGPNKSRDKMAALGLTLSAPLTPEWSHRLLVGWTRDHLTTDGTFGFELEGQTRQLDWQHTIAMGPENTLLLGYEYDQDRAVVGPAGDQTMTTNSVYAQGQIAMFDPLALTIGGRTDGNNRFGRHNTYKLGASFAVAPSQTRIFGSYGTAFKAPTLNDLFYPGFSNPNLDPETSTGYEIGVTHDLLPGAWSIGTTYFSTNFDDLITSSLATSFIPQNVESAEAQGVEVSSTLRTAKTTIRGNYTYTGTRDGSTNDQLQRRPRNKANIAFGFTPDAKSRVEAIYHYVGERLDGTSTLPGYSVVNLYASVKTSRNIEVFGRLDNAFDREYEEVTGYGTAGRSIYGGVTKRF